MIKSTKQKRIFILRRVLITLLMIGSMPFFGIGVVPFALGFSMIFKQLRILKKIRLYKHIPTSKINSLTMGLVEIKGTVEKKNRLTIDPFDNKYCVYWSVSIDISRPWARGTPRGSARTYEESSEKIPFLLADDTGSVLVVPDKADFSTIKRDSYYEKGKIMDNHDLYKRVIDFSKSRKLKSNSFWRDFWAKIAYIEPGDQLYIIGNARPLTNEEKAHYKNAKAAIEYSNEKKIFLISDRSKTSLINRAQTWKIFTGIILIIISIILIIFPAPNPNQ